MEKETTSQHKPLLTAQLERCCPAVLLQALTAVAQARHSELYLVGGTVRDLLTGRLPKDLDCTVAVDAAGFCHDVRELLTTGTIVPLGTELEEAARLVWQGYEVDVSAFRRGATTIEQDLSLRDFSINAMAIRLDRRAGTVLDIIDPMGGASDLQNHLLNHCPEAFFHDPLRLLRAYRFMATLDLDLAPATRADVRRFAARIVSVSGERIYSELHEIVLCSGSSDILWQMHEDGLLAYILPELYVGRGVKQPDFHHLDVFEHNFQTLRELERLLDSPQEVYPDNWQTIAGYLNETRVRSCLKWAALLHDVGKPAVRGVGGRDGDRVTFYNHDRVGRELFIQVARRLKWSNADRDCTASLISLHMYPFHLCNVRRAQGLSRRAALKLYRRAGDNLPGLFLLAMADSLASEGRLKPEYMEDELVALYREVVAIHQQHIRPALLRPPLLSGHDLIDHCGLEPGPVFSEILREIQALQVEGAVTTRQQALAWVKNVYG